MQRGIYYKTRYNRNIKANPIIKFILHRSTRKNQDYKLINHHVFKSRYTKKNGRI